MPWYYDLQHCRTSLTIRCGPWTICAFIPIVFLGPSNLLLSLFVVSIPSTCQCILVPTRGNTSWPAIHFNGSHSSWWLSRMPCFRLCSRSEMGLARPYPRIMRNVSCSSILMQSSSMNTISPFYSFNWTHSNTNFLYIQAFSNRLKNVRRYILYHIGDSANRWREWRMLPRSSTYM